MALNGDKVEFRMAKLNFTKRPFIRGRFETPMDVSNVIIRLTGEYQYFNIIKSDMWRDWRAVRASAVWEFGGCGCLHLMYLKYRNVAPIRRTARCLTLKRIVGVDECVNLRTIKVSGHFQGR